MGRITPRAQKDKKQAATMRAHAHLCSVVLLVGLVLNPLLIDVAQCQQVHVNSNNNDLSKNRVAILGRALSKLTSSDQFEQSRDDLVKLVLGVFDTLGRVLLEEGEAGSRNTALMQLVQRVEEHVRASMARDIAGFAVEALESSPALASTLNALFISFHSSPALRPLATVAGNGFTGDVARRVFTQHAQHLNLTWPGVDLQDPSQQKAVHIEPFQQKGNKESSSDNDVASGVVGWMELSETSRLQRGGNDCGPGTFWTGILCAGCVEGTFKSEAGAGNCQACASCEPGSIRIACGDSSPGVCQPCGPNTYVPVSTNTVLVPVCEACGLCPVTTFRRGCNGSFPGTCVACLTDAQCPSGQYATECSRFENGVCQKCARSERECYSRVENTPFSPWFLNVKKSYVQSTNRCFAKLGEQSGTCEECTKCMFWAHLWAGGCGEFQDNQCTTPAFQCGTTRSSLSNKLKGTMEFTGIVALVALVGPLLRAAGQLTRDALFTVVVIMMLGFANWFFNVIARFSKATASQPTIAIDQSDVIADQLTVQNRMNKIQIVQDPTDKIMPDGVAMGWQTTALATLALFTIYSLIRLWSGVISSRMCSTWASPIIPVLILPFLLTLHASTGCSASYNILEDVMGIFWACVALFLFGRANTHGNLRDGDDCLTQLVVPRIFLILLAHAIPYLSAVTLTEGPSNVLLKSGILAVVLSVLSAIDKSKKVPLRPPMCFHGPSKVQNGHYIERPKDQTATAPIPHHFDGEIISAISCDHGFEMVSELAVCRCLEPQHLDDSDSQFAIGLTWHPKKLTSKCEDLEGELSPCITPEKILVMGYARKM